MLHDVEYEKIQPNKTNNRNENINIFSAVFDGHILIGQDSPFDRIPQNNKLCVPNLPDSVV